MFKLVNLAVEGFHHAFAGGIDDLLKITVDLTFQFEDFTAHGFARLSYLRGALVPCVVDHLPDYAEQAGIGAHLPEKRREIAFDIIAPDGFAVTLATLRVAEVIGMFLFGLALRPTGAQRLFAITASHESA